MDNPLWSPLIGRLDPYVPGEQPAGLDLVKLNTNENPFGPSPKVLEAIGAELGDNLRLYPPVEGGALLAAVASYYKLAENQVFVGNGSDEVLAHAFQAFFTSRPYPVLFPDISYSFYPVYCALYGIDFKQIPLAADFSLQLEDYGVDNGGVIFPNPNAPTGMALELGAIETLLQRNSSTVVVVDEAYVDFGATSAVPLIAEYPNLLVVQTMSKSRSLAGLRVGFAMGDKGLIEALSRVKNSFNSYPLDRLAIAGATAALGDEHYFQQTRVAIIANREQLSDALRTRGFDVLPSAANFVFARHREWDAGELTEALRDRQVLVRHFNRPRIDAFVRITVGTEHQQHRLLTALDDILSG